MTWADQRAELELRARGVLCDEADIGLDDRHLALLDHKHRHHLDGDEERIEGVGTVEQWIVLKSDLASLVEECLEVLVIVVKLVLAAENCLDQLLVLAALALTLLDILEAPEATGDVPRRERITLEGSHDPHGVHDMPHLFGPRSDPHQIELLEVQAERLRHQTALLVSELTHVR